MSPRHASVIAVALAVALAACADNAVRLDLVLELPSTDDEAAPTGLDTFVLSIAHARSDQDLASRSFSPGQRVELTTVPFADDLVVHLSGQIGGSPVAYGRTCMFAVTADEAAPSPHLWFSRNVKFATLPLAPIARDTGVAIDFAGSAILVGGSDPAIERFDPRTGELARIGQHTPRSSPAMAQIGLGGAQRIAVVGGAIAGAPAGILELVEIVDGGPARVERIVDGQLARIAATATTLTDGRVVVIGGRLGGGAPSNSLVELTTGGTGTEIRSVRATLAAARSEHTATRLGDDVGAPVLIAGGLGTSGLVATAELWKPLSGELANPASFAPAMVVPRRGHRAELMPDGSVLLIGGVDAAGAPVRTLERFAIDAGFVAVGELPLGAGIIDITTTRLPDGRILIAGGRDAPGGPAVDAAMIARLDVVDGSVDVVQTDRLAIVRAGHVAVPLCDGTVWISGGNEGGAAAERYNPPPAGRR